MNTKKPANYDPDIKVLWQCGMGEDCLNREEPGIHRGDWGYEHAQQCVHQHEPRDLKRLGLH